MKSTIEDEITAVLEAVKWLTEHDIKNGISKDIKFYLLNACNRLNKAKEVITYQEVLKND